MEGRPVIGALVGIDDGIVVGCIEGSHDGWIEGKVVGILLG